MSTEFKKQFEAIIDKYTELLLGDMNEELKEKVQYWIIYQHIAKSMPALAKHWNTLYPEAKEEIKKIIQEIKQLNEQHRMNQKKNE